MRDVSTQSRPDVCYLQAYLSAPINIGKRGVQNRRNVVVGLQHLQEGAFSSDDLPLLYWYIFRVLFHATFSLT